MSEFDVYRDDYNDRQAMADWDQKYLYGDTNEPEPSVDTTSIENLIEDWRETLDFLEPHDGPQVAAVEGECNRPTRTVVEGRLAEVDALYREAITRTFHVWKIVREEVAKEFHDRP